VKEKELKHQRMVATLADLFLCTDSDNSETVDKDEFIAAMQDDSFVARLTELSIPVLEAQHLFDVLDIDGSGQITLPEFLDGFTRVAGVAKSKDLLQVHCDLTKHFRTLGKLLSTNTETWSAMLRLVRRQLAQQMRDIKAALPPRGLPPPSRKDPGGPSAGVPPPVPASREDPCLLPAGVASGHDAAGIVDAAHRELPVPPLLELRQQVESLLLAVKGLDIAVDSAGGPSDALSGVKQLRQEASGLFDAVFHLAPD